MYRSIRCRWVVSFVMFTVVLAACSAPLPTATVTGNVPPEVPGQYVFETLCASCHGEQGSGARAPALTGHTADQVFRQVRAPVGEMPMFSSERLTEFGLEDVASYVVNLPDADADAAHGAHAHGLGLSKQEAGEIVHILLSRALQNQDLELAAHYSMAAQTNLVGNHLNAMVDISSSVGQADLGAALAGVEAMLVASSATTDSSDAALITLLTHSAAANDDMAGVEHWLAHLLSLDDPQIDLAALEEALAEGDLEEVAELLARPTADVEHDGAADDVHDDSAPHDESDPDAEDIPQEDAETDAPVPDHDDAEPHDH
jgi:hypothetical protein